MGIRYVESTASAAVGDIEENKYGSLRREIQHFF
jgi:hypothetical protein